MGEEASCSIQLIDGDGGFNVYGVERKLNECGLSYAVVSIMGLQSSVQSTLLYHLFKTNFREMDVYRGRCCHDVGREQTANKPFLKTVFQVIMCLFSPRKTTLLFVIRDKSRTPLENLEPILREDIQKIWDSVPKPEAHKETPLSEFLNRFKSQLCQVTRKKKSNSKNRLLVVTVRCEEIANEKLANEWIEFEEEMQHNIVPGFGKKTQ